MQKVRQEERKTCGIFHPFSLSREEVVAHIAGNLQDQDRIQSHAPMLRELHLRSNMKKAKERGDTKKANNRFNLYRLLGVPTFLRLLHV